MTKNQRHAKIMEFIQNNTIDRQEDIAKYLNDIGIPVTQATVSRDIHNLGLVKQVIDGSLRYVKPVIVNDADFANKMSSIFSSSVKKIDITKNLIVIHTLSGMAQAAAATIDAIHSLSILGCIAGDDTILVIMRSDSDAETMKETFDKMRKE